MEKIILVIFNGEGRAHADCVSILLFDLEEDANQFISESKKLESNYWTFAKIAKEGEVIQIPYNQ